MNTLDFFIKNAFRVEHNLVQHERYLAHLPKYGDNKPDETLAEHLDLVISYFQKLCIANSIEDTIDNLIGELLGAQKNENQVKIGNYLKQLFIATITFHDNGKINENFQTDRMKNNKFVQRSDTIIKPAHGHSALGAFIYIIYFFEDIVKQGFDDDELSFLAGIILVLADAIFLHHSPAIFRTPLEEVEKSVILKNLDFLKPYLENYKFDLPSSISIFIFENLSKIFNDLLANEKIQFSIYSLLRLNFSLLTASDYLATSEYMSGISVEKFGTIDAKLRNEIILNSLSSKKYNSETFLKAESLANSDVEALPTTRSGENLNKLREIMAAEAINQVRLHSEKKLFYLEAPTGGGKTNISMLVAAELLKLNPELNKVIYVFPFTTLITQTHKSILETWGLSTDDVALMHSASGFQTKIQDKEETDDGLYSNQKLNQLNNLFAFYPISLMTHIRFFDILKSNDKEAIYLTHRLSNSIVILDELQTYNPSHWDKMIYFIENYAKLFNMRFILMSATLPKIDKLKLPITQRPNFVELLQEPKRFFTNPNFSDRVLFNFDLLKKKITLDDLAIKVIKESRIYAEPNGSVHTIIEFIFKKSATIFKEVIEKYIHPFEKIFVLSGTILEHRRLEIINFLKNVNNRKLNILLITTQVVEAGVDIDMDLGFKNQSLIDSDEQLAGRVNRNVIKEPCTVYLFHKDDASMLYKLDYRFAAMRHITESEHAEILKTKNFQKLYDEVLFRIDNQNSNSNFVNFNNDYLPYIQNIDFKQVSEKFKLIESKNISIFVPLPIPINVEGIKHIAYNPDYDNIFSDSELNFLIKFNCYKDGEKTVNGSKVWLLYRNLIENKMPDFTEQIVSMKTIQGVLAKFTFSIFFTDKLQQTMMQFLNLDLGFERYWYLNPNENIYSINEGLKTERFGDSENYIL